MKKAFFPCGLVALLVACRHEEEATNYKDLEQNMMDLKLYQENMGDELKRGRLADAGWFLEGMDSILHIVSKKFDTHHRLNAPFSKGYNKELETPIKNIRKAVDRYDKAGALDHYRIMVKGCNNCHYDNDVDKDVKF